MIAHNFLITNPNGMNQKIYNLWGEKITKKIELLQISFFCLLSLVLSLFGHSFCSRAPIEKKNHIPTKLISFSIFKKVSKNHIKNSAHRYLPEIPFVPQIDNGL